MIFDNFFRLRKFCFARFLDLEIRLVDTNSLPIVVEKKLKKRFKALFSSFHLRRRAALSLVSFRRNLCLSEVSPVFRCVFQWGVPNWPPGEKSIWCRKFGDVVESGGGVGTLRWAPEVPQCLVRRPLGGCQGSKWPKMEKWSFFF